MTTSRQLMEDLFRGRERVRVGLREVNIWPETLRAWIEQGYPTQPAEANAGAPEIEADDSCDPTRTLAKPDIVAQRAPVDWRDHFGYDIVQAGPWFDTLPLCGYSETVQETDAWIIRRNGGGAALKYWKHKSGTPEHIDFRMTSRAVWERDYRAHLLAVDRQRLEIEGTRRELLQRHEQGRWVYYGNLFLWETLRRTLGDVCMYESLALDPDWIHDMNRVYTGFFKSHFRILFEEAGVPDCARLAEDLGYKNGLFCSPRILAELFMPYYQEIIDFFHSYGMLVELHSCGNITEAVPLFVEAGFDILNPMEAKAGCDALALAERYGGKLAFIGGLDVRVLESGDRALIRQEVAALIEGMKARGARYVFGSDHSLTPQVRYQDYLYALEVYREHMMY